MLYLHASSSGLSKQSTAFFNSYFFNRCPRLILSRYWPDIVTHTMLISFRSKGHRAPRNDEVNEVYETMLSDMLWYEGPFLVGLLFLDKHVTFCQWQDVLTEYEVLYNSQWKFHNIDPQIQKQFPYQRSTLVTLSSSCGIWNKNT